MEPLHISLGTAAVIIGVIWKLWSMNRAQTADAVALGKWREKKDVQYDFLKEQIDKHEKKDEAFMLKIEQDVEQLTHTMASMSKDLNQVVGLLKQK